MSHVLAIDFRKQQLKAINMFAAALSMLGASVVMLSATPATGARFHALLAAMTFCAVATDRALVAARRFSRLAQRSTAMDDRTAPQRAGPHARFLRGIAGTCIFAASVNLIASIAQGASAPALASMLLMSAAAALHGNFEES